MPTGIFPYIGCYGSSETDKFDEKIIEFGDNEYAGNNRGAVMQTHVNLLLKSFNKTKIVAARAFWRAHKAASTKTAKEFYYYSPLEATQADIDGDTGVGKYIAIFVENEATWTRDGRCRYSANLGIKILSEV